MKFKNKLTGVVLEPASKEVIEQLKQNENYEIVVEKKVEKPVEKTSSKKEEE